MAHALLLTRAMKGRSIIMRQEMEKILLTTKEISWFLRISTTTIDKYRKRGLIPYIKLPNGQVRFEQKKIMQWIDKKSVPGI
jgi:predicted DNA-binding transcriptional regulator AlpA